MATGRHIGKVVTKIRDEESELVCPPRKKLIRAVRRTLCNPTHAYVLVGGLGGIGLELAQWLVSRGVRK